MIYFHKYQGAGNDFVMVNNLDNNIVITPEEIIHICDRHFGVGADGVILVDPSISADCFMNYYNSDGTVAEMCGNGARCTARFFIEQTKLGKVLPYSIKIETRAGIKEISINEDDTYSVNMGKPNFENSDFPSEKINLEELEWNFVSIGNPHAVTLVEDLDKIEIKSIGPKVENDKYFPNKINVEFVQKISDNLFKVKVWERGCGETLACGTGACAVYAILNKKEKFEKEITLEFPGGKLFLSSNEKSHIILRGPASFVFKGKI